MGEKSRQDNLQSWSGLARTMRHPLDLLLTTALPSCVLAVLFRLLTPVLEEEQLNLEEYEVLYEYLYGQLTELSESMALGLWIAVIVAAIVLAGYGVWALVRKKPVANPVWIGVSVFYCGWLTLVLWSLRSGFSLSTTEPWMVVCLLCMLPVFYSMANIVLWLTPLDRDHSVGKTLLPFIAIPVLWFLIVNTLRYAVAGHAMTIVLMLAVAVTYGFLFVLMRVVYLLVHRQDSARTVIRAVVLFVLPLLGLLVTQLTPEFSFFWDFGSPWYYLLVVANGALMLLPEPGRTPLRLLLLFGRCATYMMVLYFFVCLAPFYTLSFIGILVFGLGVLVLAPVFLIGYQTRVLWTSGKALFRDRGGARTIAAALAGLLLLPVAVTASFYGDKDNFSLAMHYLTDNTAAVGQDEGPVDIEALENSINYVRRGGGEMSFASVSRYRDYYYPQNRLPPPLLSSLHNLVVNADEYVENGSTYAGLQALYFGAPNSWTGYARPVKVEGNEYVQLEDVWVETVEEGEYYRSIVHLTIREQTAIKEAAAAAEETRAYEGVYSWGEEDDVPVPTMPDNDYYDDYSSERARTAEYATAIRLPEGVFISGYYLDVLGERKSGLLAERSSAQWIYNTVVNSALDPGIVYYDGTDVILKVFPFEDNEVRYTGIEFLHNGPAAFEIDGFQVELAPNAAEPTGPIIEDNGAVYISATAKNGLPTVNRTPHYMFVVDCSENAPVEEYALRIRSYCEREGIPSEAAMVTALNYRRDSWPMTRDDWQERLLAFDREGGFGFGLMADALCREFDIPDAYPVFVLVTNSMDRAILPQDTSYLEAVSPELYGYYRLPDQTPDENGSISDLGMFLFGTSPLLDRYPAVNSSVSMRVLELDGETHYLHDDGSPEILYHKDAAITAPEYQGAADDWATALSLMGDYRRSLEHLGEERMTLQLELVKNSFRTGIMTPLTSFIVLETQAQEDLMLERQRRLLESGDLERTIDMSADGDGWTPENPETPEPSLLLCGIIAAIALLIHRRRKKIKYGSCAHQS